MTEYSGLNGHVFYRRMNHAHPMVSHGQGIYLFDTDGKRYIDASGGPVLVNVGHGIPEIVEAMTTQAKVAAYVHATMFTSQAVEDYSAALAEVTPLDNPRFFCLSSGSEAVETAIKFARQVQVDRGEGQRYQIISRWQSYHGTTLGALAVSGRPGLRRLYQPMMVQMPHIEPPYCYRCPYELAYPDCELKCARDIERAVEFENPELITAFIGEPIMQGFGVVPPPKEYWPIVREICNKYGILLIIDEVICGFGRTGKMFGVEHFGINPDMLTMAKGISSGYVPLGAVGCTDKVMEPIENFFHLHTYGNHPVACAAALKNIEIMQTEKLINNSEKMGQYFLQCLKNLEQHAIVGEARGRGLWLALDLTVDKKTHAPFPTDRIANMIRRAKHLGVIIKAMGCALEFAPPLIVTKEEIDEALKVIEQCITEEEKNMRM